ncbi:MULTISPECIES: hypothetical protein [Alcaligenes]|uniref:hypothetical protein n=1 Tax=Alcaligenes TaxID=507 RepID=UPI00202DED9D|nr:MULTISPECIES: hypothetical protein [Alcaligenes]URW83908.1 hypothetical protein NBV64_06020 [Alcaligenes sp. DN25]WEA68746.1 hypothetical protein PWH35_06030 [Alcaligenes faecalis]
MDVMSYLTGITHAVSAYKTAVQTLDDAKITAATHELTVQLTHFGAEVLSMQKDGVQATERERELLTRIHRLEDQVQELEKLRADRDRYKLVELSADVFTLALKEEHSGDDPPHHLCQPCMDNRGKKAALQRTVEGFSIKLACPECGYKYPTGRSVNFS